MVSLQRSGAPNQDPNPLSWSARAPKSDQFIIKMFTIVLLLPCWRDSSPELTVLKSVERKLLLRSPEKVRLQRTN